MKMKELAERVATLKANIHNLPKSKIDFAASLLDQFDRKGQLSDRQWFWVQKLADESEGIPDFTRENADVGPLHGLMAMFEKAKSKLKYPKIELQTESGIKVVLSLAGPKSKYPGTINLTDGGSFYNNVWYGRVTPEGEYQPNPSISEASRQEVANLLRELSRHPADTAAKYGKLTGNCCFCKSTLTDEKSTSVGYGPVCAKNFGLPWGNKA